MPRHALAIAIYTTVLTLLPAQQQARPQFKTDEVLVSARDGRSAQVKELIAAAHGSVMKTDSVSGLLRVKVPAGTATDLIAQWNEHADVAFAERNAIGYADYIPSDTHFGLQWHLQNSGQTGGTPGADIRAVDAWDVTTGSPNVVIAVLDSGIDSDHPDFAGRIDPNGYDFVYNDNDPEAVFPHGTLVSGALCANGDNGFGIAGVDWQCKLLPLQVLADDGTGNQFDVMAAINYCTTLPDVRVISMSLSFSYSGPAAASVLQSAHAAGMVIVASASNAGFGGADSHWPSSSPYTITVGATDTNDWRAVFSGTGAALDFVAPGTMIVTSQNDSSADTYAVASGCSMSVPLVSGITGLVFARAEQLGIARPTPEEVYDVLRAGARDQVGPASQDPPGRDNLFGHGRIDARLVIDAVASLSDCGDGAVGVGAGGPFDVLRVNGLSTANGLRTIPVPAGAPMAVSMDVPPSLPQPGPMPAVFVLAASATNGIPATPTTLPFGWGDMCFDPTAPSTFLTLVGIAPWTANTPPMPIGLMATLQAIIIDNAQGDIAVTNRVTYDPIPFPAPTIGGTSPAWPSPGDQVVLSGSGFQSGATVTINGTMITPTSIDATSLTFVAPANTSCDMVMSVDNPDGQSALTTYNRSPVISAVSPPAASAAGGSLIILMGQDLGTTTTPGSTVMIGGNQMAITLQGSGVIMGTLPPGTVGTAAIVITSPTGCTGTSSLIYTQ